MSTKEASAIGGEGAPKKRHIYA